MERNQKALEMARAEREMRLRSVDSPSHAPSGASVEDTALIFARTPVAPLDRAVLRRNRLLLPGVVGEAAHSFKMLRTQVLQRLRSRNWNTLAIVSPAPGDGKTFTAINLAIAIIVRGNDDRPI